MSWTALRTRIWPWRSVAFWTLLFIAALLLDNAVAQAAATHYRMVKHHSTLAMAIKELGRYGVMSAVVVFLILFHARHWWAGALMLTGCAIGGFFEVTLKWIAGRQRPVHGQSLLIDPFTLAPFRGGLPGFLQQHNLCFPSGHATVAFAMAACLACLAPRGKVLWFTLATLVGLERLAELAHYPSDVVGGAICGVFSFHLARRGFYWLDQPRSHLPARMAENAMDASSQNRGMSY
jgi:undecaprenyl-diphosphatase